MTRWRAWIARLLACCMLACCTLALPAVAHEVRPAYLQLQQIDDDTWDVLWKVPGLGEDRRLALDVVFAPGTTTQGTPHVTFANGAFLQRSRIHRADGLEGTQVRIAGLQATVTDVIVRIQRRDGTAQTLRVTPSAPQFTLARAPGLPTVARTYLVLGIDHILSGFDHLLFVFALILLVRKRATLLWTITAFTLAHSLTLAAATLGVVHVPPPPVEASIALSIAFLASELLRQRRGEAGLTARRPWLVAFAFGLLHGLGFAGALSDIGLPSNAIPMALLFFNVGVELGQVAFILAVLAVLAAVRRVPLQAPWLRTASAYAIGGLAMFWTLQRVAQF